MKKLLLLIMIFVANISFAQVAQEIDLKTFTKSQRENYIIKKSTEALDLFLHDYLKDLEGLDTPKPTYVPSSLGITEYTFSTDEEVEDFNRLALGIMDDFTIVKNDIAYGISFSKSAQHASTPIYSTLVLSNGKVFYINKVDAQTFPIIYNRVP